MDNIKPEILNLKDFIPQTEEKTGEKKLKVIQMPLHLKPDDFSPEECIRRFDHHMSFFMLSPSGFRKPGIKRGITKPVFKRDRMKKISTIAANHLKKQQKTNEVLSFKTDLPSSVLILNNNVEKIS